MEIKKPQRFSSTILGIEKLTENVKHFSLSVPKGFDFIPGQYVSIIMDNPGKGIKLRRPYSIVSSLKECKDGSIELCIKILENGNITPLLNKLKRGDKIECLGPLGNFKISEESKDKSVIFVSTGVGIAPFMSMIPSLLEINKKNGVKKEIVLLIGYRNNKDILYDKSLKELSKKYPDFSYHTILSKSGNGEDGRVQKLVEEHFDKEADYYLCGLKNMINSVRSILIKKGVEMKSIFSEKYD
ncbi:hypothetical protein AUJ62_01700 [Candidatus Pacearchaeota archaeon CG1_02_32_21]|nr:MAG: hypothetical protein AUJ62_01700 [Candidatus Pacearchaeota archaeon CG1_02_32_21]